MQQLTSISKAIQILDEIKPSNREQSTTIMDLKTALINKLESKIKEICLENKEQRSD